jgi:hypothetical protein
MTKHILLEDRTTKLKATIEKLEAGKKYWDSLIGLGYQGLFFFNNALL